MLKGQTVKCENIIIGKQIECKIVNPKYNETSIEVQIVEGNFKGQYAIVNLNDVIVIETIKSSASIEFSKYEVIDDYAETQECRYIDINITVKSNNTTNAEMVLDNIIENMENLDSNIKFNRCIVELSETSVLDGFILPFEYGEMTDTKKYIKDLFKQVKKGLGIR